MCIVAGGLLNRLGKARPELTGDGTNIMKVDQKLIKEDVTADITMDDILGTLLLGGACYGVGTSFQQGPSSNCPWRPDSFFCIHHSFCSNYRSFRYRSEKYPYNSKKNTGIYDSCCGYDDHGRAWI